MQLSKRVEYTPFIREWEVVGKGRRVGGEGTVQEGGGVTPFVSVG